MKARTRKARLRFRDANGQTWTVEWDPVRSVLVGRRLHARTTLTMSAVRLAGLLTEHGTENVCSKQRMLPL